MKLTTRSEYALLALIHLCRQDPDTFVSVDAIARAQSIPVKYLEQILLAMKRARLVRKRQGAARRLPARQSGRSDYTGRGHPAVRWPAGFDGLDQRVLLRAHAHRAGTPPARFFKEIRDMVAKRMESVTIADVQ